MQNKNQYIGYRITRGNRYYIGIVRAIRWDIACKAHTDKTKGFIPATPYYLGSGVAIREAVIKHGWQAFERKIVARFDNRQDASAWERANAVMQEVDPLSYNINSGGKIGFKVGKIGREKMSKAKAGENNPFFGKPSKDHPRYGKRAVNYKPDAVRLPSGRISRAKTPVSA